MRMLCIQVLADEMILPWTTTQGMRGKEVEKAIMTTETGGEEAVGMRGIWDAKIGALLLIHRKMKGQVRDDNLVEEEKNAVFMSGTFRTLWNGRI